MVSVNQRVSDNQLKSLKEDNTKQFPDSQINWGTDVPHVPAYYLRFLNLSNILTFFYLYANEQVRKGFKIQHVKKCIPFFDGVVWKSDVKQNKKRYTLQQSRWFAYGASITPLSIFTKKLHRRCSLRFCICFYFSKTFQILNFFGV